MFKKIALFTALTLASSISFAMPCNKPTNKWYAGVDGQYAFFKNSTNRWGASVLGGYRWDCTALELGLTGYSNQNTPLYETDSRSNVYLDGNYFHNLAGNLELRAAAGVGYLSTKHSTYPNTSSKLGGRVGAGLQYNFTKNVNSSLMYRYQFFKRGTPNVQTVALSVAYAF
jgi:outer membrane autotransporter protein